MGRENLCGVKLLEYSDGNLVSLHLASGTKQNYVCEFNNSARASVFLRSKESVVAINQGRKRNTQQVAPSF